MPGDGKFRHCRHCLGDNCPGDCLLGDGQCIPPCQRHWFLNEYVLVMLQCQKDMLRMELV